MALLNYDHVSRSLGYDSKTTVSDRSPASALSEGKPNIDSLKLNWVSFIHATISQGNSNENISGNLVDSEQNSPFTIFAGFAYFLQELKGYSDTELTISRYGIGMRDGPLKTVIH